MQANAAAKMVYMTREAAQMLAVSQRTMEGLIAAKRIAVIRIGRSVRIPHAALVEFLERQTTAAAK
jgi:excisionase family DNA binding protein